MILEICVQLAHSVATFIVRKLYVDPELMAEKNVVQIFRMNYYPQC